MSELKYQRSGCVTDECIIEIGKELSANYVVNGSINKIGKSFQINIKLVDMQQGEMTEKVTDRFKGGEEELFDGIEQLSLELVRRIVSSSGGGASGPVQSMTESTVSLAYGIIEVATTPSNANIVIDGQEVGLSPVRKENIVTGQHRIVIVLPGYETITKIVNVMEGKSSNVDEILAPQTGGLTLISDPIGAKVFLDGQLKGKAPISLSDLPAKDYMVKITLDHYEETTTRITIEYQQELNRRITLKPLDGLLTVRTSPGNVDFVINQKKYNSGNSGLKIVPIPVGKHPLRFLKKGYEDAFQAINIGPEEEKFLEINLKKTPLNLSSNPDVGFLTITTLNKFAKVAVKGVKKPQDLPLEFFELKYGSYPLKMYRKGWETKKETVEIKKQQTTRINVIMMPKSKRKAVFYSLMFPGAGQIYADNKIKGFAFSILGSGMVSLLIGKAMVYNEENETIGKFQTDYQNAITASEIETTWQVYQNQVNEVNDLQSQLLIYGGGLAATWFINVVDAYLFNGLKGD
jgi:TM2 domain-containing membrane protein YozV